MWKFIYQSKLHDDTTADYKALDFVSLVEAYHSCLETSPVKVLKIYDFDQSALDMDSFAAWWDTSWWPCLILKELWFTVMEILRLVWIYQEKFEGFQEMLHPCVGTKYLSAT